MALNEEVSPDELERKLQTLDAVVRYYEHLTNLPESQKRLLDLIDRLQHCLARGIKTLEEVVKVLEEFKQLLEEA